MLKIVMQECGIEFVQREETPEGAPEDFVPGKVLVAVDPLTMIRVELPFVSLEACQSVARWLAYTPEEFEEEVQRMRARASIELAGGHDLTGLARTFEESGPQQ